MFCDNELCRNVKVCYYVIVIKSKNLSTCVEKVKMFFKSKDKKRYCNDGIFINNGDGTFTVFYSKYFFLKKGDLLNYDCFRDVLHCYESVLITSNYEQEENK